MFKTGSLLDVSSLVKTTPEHWRALTLVLKLSGLVKITSEQNSLAVSHLLYLSQSEGTVCVWRWCVTFLSGLQMKDRPVEAEVLTDGPGD